MFVDMTEREKKFSCVLLIINLKRTMTYRSVNTYQMNKNDIQGLKNNGTDAF
jgi:hypothetical protein